MEAGPLKCVISGFHSPDFEDMVVYVVTLSSTVIDFCNFEGAHRFYLTQLRCPQIIAYFIDPALEYLQFLQMCCRRQFLPFIL